MPIAVWSLGLRTPVNWTTILCSMRRAARGRLGSVEALNPNPKTQHPKPKTLNPKPQSPKPSGRRLALLVWRRLQARWALRRRTLNLNPTWRLVAQVNCTYNPLISPLSALIWFFVQQISTGKNWSVSTMNLHARESHFQSCFSACGALPRPGPFVLQHPQPFTVCGMVKP